MHKYEIAEVSILLGKTLTAIELVKDDFHSSQSYVTEIIFTCDDGGKYRMYHDQTCCESVTVEDICGELDDLIGTPILMAEEVIHPENENPEEVTVLEVTVLRCFIWTFYKFATIKGYVTIRWYGESNCNYSESVDFVKMR